ncbi:MAG: NADP-dependent isocitrate dehydrogenase [Firmicutes bacterium]|nr:NADP-dependent isocitrate dehydrogenase [Bacillota bacterium]
MIKKIIMKKPIVEMQGDEMTRILWDWIKELLIEPYVTLKVAFFDLGLAEREKTDDKVTHEAAAAIKKHRVGVKCATITPNAQRMEEYKLSKMWLSPNGTIRAALDGTVFRTPVVSKNLKSFVPGWVSPITVARHAYGDLYRNQEFLVEGAGAVGELVLKYADGNERRRQIAAFDGGGVLQGIHNTDKSIASFARASFTYALSVKQDLWFGTKDTISKTYDHRFKDIFGEIFESEFADKFKEAGINYDYTLIDDSVARVMRSSGGFVWALKNYDGDVMSDMVASAFGSLAMMTSVLVSPDGCFEYEAAHGTVTRHYYKYQNGEKTSTNPVATIFAWSGALRKRGELDGSKRLVKFATKLETATLKTIERGTITGDLASLYKGRKKPRVAETREFLEEIQKILK